MTGRLLRKPRILLALTAAAIGFGVFSSSVGIGALPVSTLPVYGVTDGNGSRTTVAELGDVNGDGKDDYAVGMPYADANGSDSGIVYVFLGPVPAPASLNVASASFRIVGHAGELLGFSLGGGDVNGDGLADIAIGAPMAGPPARVGGGAVYVVFGSAHPVDVDTTDLSGTAHTNGTNPAPHSTIGSRYDGFLQNGHMGMSLAVLPDVNGDGYADIATGSPDADLHRPGGGAVAVLYGKPSGEHISLTDLWSAGYPYFFHVDFPDLDNQHIGESVAAVPDMTGDGWPDLAIGAPQADPGGRIDAGSVWIISGHLPPIDAGCTGMNLDASCPWIKLNTLTAAQGYRIDGAVAGEGIGSSLAAVGDQNGDGLPDLAIGASAASPAGRTNAGEVVVMAGQAGSAASDTGSALERIWGALGGRRARSIGRDCRRHRRRPPHRPAGGRAGRGLVRRRRLLRARTAGCDRGSLPRRIPLQRRPRRGGRPDGQRGRGRARHRPGRGAGRQRRSRGRLQRDRQRLAGSPRGRLRDAGGDGRAGGRARRQESARQAPQALPAHEAQAEVPPRQGQAREDQARALPAAPQEAGQGQGAGARRPGDRGLTW